MGKGNNLAEEIEGGAITKGKKKGRPRNKKGKLGRTSFPKTHGGDELKHNKRRKEDENSGVERGESDLRAPS